jgi:hypothetical protein
MFHPNQLRTQPIEFAPAATLRSGCLVEGCPCKDARIVSHRRARFFAAVARRNGETATRVVDVDPEWRLPGVTEHAAVV